MAQGMNQRHIQLLLALTRPHCKPITSLLLQFPRDIVRVEVGEMSWRRGGKGTVAAFGGYRSHDAGRRVG